MPIYQTGKQLTKFALVGISAVCVDFMFYYLLSQFLPVDISKGLSFASGTYVTYNLNKYWTWRQNDKNNKRLGIFIILYIFSMLINVGINSLALKYLPNTEILIFRRNLSQEMIELFAMKTDKFVAFFIATAVSSVFNFLGQKYWVFKGNGDDNEDDNKEEELPPTDTDDSGSLPE